ncbi:mammalian cell entry protein [Mycolicibacterium sp. (ex Dasyatis americana)]|nr:mammalian cell entry protein [Mycolicibacterium sp. (ex Dasyatis americana)]
MSPRRRCPVTDASEEPAPRRHRSGLALASGVAAVVAGVAIAMSVMVLISHHRQHRTTLREAAALGYVQAFMTDFTSPDPFHANDYADRILAQATGEFADHYRANQNQILVGVARSEPTTGTVIQAGVSRSNTDGSVEVLIVTKLATTSPDGKYHLERASRWAVTTTQEEERWKISSLKPMI